MEDNNNGGIVIQKKHIVIGVIILLLLLIFGIVIGANWNNWFGDRQPENDARLDIDPNAGEFTEEPRRDEEGEDAGIKIPGYPSITIAKDTTNVRMALMNPEGNPCYFKFEIVLKDTGETIYESSTSRPERPSQMLHSQDRYRRVSITRRSKSPLLRWISKRP